MPAAVACLLDASCSMDRYASLVLAAVDAGESVDACRDLLVGTGVPVDEARSRKCYEVQVAAQGPCRGGSPFNERLQLALLLLAGRGGPVSSVEASKLLEGCFEDGSVQGMATLVEARASGKSVDLSSVELCAAGRAETTLHMVGCLRGELHEVDVRERALEKAIRARFGAAVALAFRTIGADHDAYAAFASDIVGDPYAGGTMQPLQVLGARVGIRLGRIERWETLTRGEPLSAPDAPTARAELLRARDATLAMDPPQTVGRTFTAPQWRARLFAGEKVYGAYRAKELALVKTIDAMDPVRVEAAMDVERKHALDMVLPE